MDPPILKSCLHSLCALECHQSLLVRKLCAHSLYVHLSAKHHDISGDNHTRIYIHQEYIGYFDIYGLNATRCIMYSKCTNIVVATNYHIWTRPIASFSPY
jgi:hypothetical protein